MSGIAEIERKGKWLIVRFPEPQRVLSWAVVGGGKRIVETVAWYRVTGDELEPPVDAKDFLKGRLKEASLPKALGLLTSVDLDGYADRVKGAEGITARSVATVGLSNALRVGDPPRVRRPVGTINILSQVSVPLSKEAFLEALSIATEARTAVLLESGIQSIETARPATGTGTDCIVIAAPVSGEGAKFAGKHTLIGHLIGASVIEAVRASLENYLAKGTKVNS